MFTGLVQETGTIVAVEQVTSGNGRATVRITIAGSSVPSDLKTGDSVAVSGVCLTAVEIRGNQFSADLAEETVKRTSLAQLKPGSLVNLELPVRPQDHLGGHVVQGHVDGTGELLALEKLAGGEDWRLTIAVPPELTRYIVPQGSICVEGISLTVARTERNVVEIAIIPHTWQATNLRQLKSGSRINIEVDILAKYVEKLMNSGVASKLSFEELLQKGRPE